jgi:hypothetical protein
MDAASDLLYKKIKPMVVDLSEYGNHSRDYILDHISDWPWHMSQKERRVLRPFIKNGRYKAIDSNGFEIIIEVTATMDLSSLVAKTGLVSVFKFERSALETVVDQIIAAVDEIVAARQKKRLVQAERRLRRAQQFDVAADNGTTIYEIEPIEEFFGPEDRVTLQEVRDRHRNQLENLNNTQTGIEEGFVYVMTNPAWSNVVKIGSAIDYETRLKTFQTGDPYRGYAISHVQYSAKREETELKTHKILAEHRINGEWFSCSVSMAISTIESVMAEN